MKKSLVLLAIVVALTTLSACKPEATLEKVSGSDTSPTLVSPLPIDYEGAVPAELQIYVGTVRLSGGPQAITGEQAAEMAILWKGYRALAASESSSPAELRGLVQQLADALSPEQREAISALQVTRADLTSVMTELGITPGGMRGGVTLTEDERATRIAERQAAGEGGMVPPPEGARGGMGGGPGGGGFGGQSGSPLSPEQLATLQAQRASSGASFGLSEQMVTALVAFLQEAS